MYAENRDSMIKKTLKSLCCSNGWCYGVFWGFDPRNSLLLTFKDAYYEEQMGAPIESMLLQAHVLGGGVIGQAAFTKNDRWMYSDAHHEIQSSLGSFDSLEVFQVDSEFFGQFSLGIKTIAVISVEPWGVVQLGSTHKNPETREFSDQVKQLFREMDRCQETDTLTFAPHSESRLFDSSVQPNSVLSGGFSQSVDQNSQSGAYSEGFMEVNNSFVLPSQSFPSTSDHQSRNLIFPAASLVENPIQIESGNHFDCSATQGLSSHGDGSLLASSWPHLASELEESMSFSNPRGYESCRNSSFNAPVNLASISIQAQQLSKDTMEAQNFTSLLNPADCRAERPSGSLTLDELFQGSHFAEAISKSGVEDDFSQWFSPQTASTPFPNLLSADLSHAAGLVQPSNLSGNNTTPNHKAENLPTNSVQSSVTDAYRSSHEVECSGIDKLLDTLGFEHGRKKAMGWNETLIPVVKGDDLNFSTDVYECISEKHVGSKMCTSNSLFSKLGLDQILDGLSTSSCTFAKSRFDDQSSSATKRRKTDNLSWSDNQVKFDSLPSFDRKMTLLHSVIDPEAKNSENSTKEPRSCVGNSCTTDAEKASSYRQEEPAKAKKKKAKPGTRPRPKDRQMIQDRLAELRELIPNGEKMSIDRLLERTIRHLNFMQSLTKHAKNLKQIDKPKSREVQKNHSINGDGGGVTWACEVGDQTMVCPLMVEDLSTPGQMLIEMLCEEQGFFLEIVDIIRGFGLTILKGVMEVRETKKIWAHFMVEAEGNRCVSRHEIFSSLIQLLQMTGQSAVNASDSYGNVISPALPAFNNFQPSASFPVNFPDALECASL